MNEDAFTVSELFDQFIRVQIGANTDQEPQNRELSDVGHDGGDFVFVRTDATATTEQ